MRITLLFSICFSISFAVQANENSYRACMSAAQGHYDEYECERLEIDSLWRENKATSNKIRTELSQCTPHMIGYDYALAKREFNAAEADFRAFVKHDCSVTDATFGQGTGRVDATNECEINHLRLRNKRLQHLLSELKQTRAYLLELSIDSPQQQGPQGWITCTSVPTVK